MGTYCRTRAPSTSLIYLASRESRHKETSEDDRGGSDDMISDEELDLTKEELAEALKTRIGGKQPAAKDVDHVDTPLELCQFENSSSAIERAQTIWAAELKGEDKKGPRFSKLPKCLSTLFKAAATSRSKDPWSSASPPATRKASLETRILPKEADAIAWLGK